MESERDPVRAERTPMKLLVIIVNYKTADLTIDALASLEPELAAVAPARVVVVDNLSGDGSVERIAAAIAARGWGAWAKLVAAEKNGGFAYGNNRGLEAGTNDGGWPAYVHLLNPDTVIRPGALASLVRFMEANPRVGIAGSRLEDPDETPQRSAFRFPGLLNEVEFSLRLRMLSRALAPWVGAPPISDSAVRTDWVAGASMIIRRAVFEAIGPLDEDYFMYFEEVDFTLRALEAGWPCWYVPESRVVHLVGQASGVTDPHQRRRRRPGYWFESRRRYYLRHLGRARTALADLTVAAGNLTWQARRIVQGKADDTPEHFLGDFVRNSVFVKGFER